MSEEDIIEVSPSTIVQVVKEGAEIYSEITASFIKEFVGQHH